MAVFFLVIGVVELAAGESLAHVSFALALMFTVPAVWVVMHPFLIRRRMLQARPGSTHRVPVTVEVADWSWGVWGSLFWQPVTLRLRSASGESWRARLRDGSGSGRDFVKRGNPWLIAHGARPEDVMAPRKPMAVPGEILMPTWSHRIGLVLHRPANAPHRPLRDLPGPGNCELIFGSDPGECLGLYLWGRLLPES